MKYCFAWFLPLCLMALIKFLDKRFLPVCPCSSYSRPSSALLLSQAWNVGRTAKVQLPAQDKQHFIH